MKFPFSLTRLVAGVMALAATGLALNAPSANASPPTTSDLVVPKAANAPPAIVANRISADIQGTFQASTPAPAPNLHCGFPAADGATWVFDPVSTKRTTANLMNAPGITSDLVLIVDGKQQARIDKEEIAASSNSLAVPSSVNGVDFAVTSSSTIAAAASNAALGYDNSHLPAGNMVTVPVLPAGAEVSNIAKKTASHPVSDEAVHLNDGAAASP